MADATRMLTVNIPADDYDAIGKLCDDHDISKSQLVRDVLAYCVEHGIDLPPDVKDGTAGRIKPSHRPAGAVRAEVTAARAELREALLHFMASEKQLRAATLAFEKTTKAAGV